MGDAQVNKILISAARYIEAMHAISVDENDPKLDSIIRKYVLELETPELINYWKAYLADIDIENANTETRESVQVIEDFEAVEQAEKAVYYRGVKIEQQPSTKGADQEGSGEQKKQAVYRGVKTK